MQLLEEYTASEPNRATIELLFCARKPASGSYLPGPTDKSTLMFNSPDIELASDCSSGISDRIKVIPGQICSLLQSMYVL